MAYQLNIREKAIENKLRKDYFLAYNAEEVLGDIDFAVAVPVDGPQLFEPEYFYGLKPRNPIIMIFTNLLFN